VITNGDEHTPAPDPAAGPPQPRSDWSAGRVIALIFATVGGLIGLLLLLGGAAVLIAYAVGRDDDGYFTSDRQRLESPTYAITTEDIDLGVDEIDWAPDGVLGEVRIQVAGEPGVFVGIGPDAAVDRYLARVAHDELIGFDGDRPELVRRPGGAEPARPGDQDFWVADAEGAGEQALAWDAEFGRWTAVVMRPDANRGIDVEADVAVKLDWAIWAGLGVFVVGLLITAGAVIVILVISRARAPG